MSSRSVVSSQKISVGSPSHQRAATGASSGSATPLHRSGVRDDLCRYLFAVPARENPRAASGKTELAWTYDRARNELSRQVSAAHDLLVRMSATDASGSIEQLSREATAWHERSKTILEQAFTTNVVKTRYDPPMRVSSAALL